MERTGLKRDAAHVEREYNQEKWPSVRREIEAAVAREGEGPQLSRVLSSVARTQWFGEASLAEHGTSSAGERPPSPPPLPSAARAPSSARRGSPAASQDTDLIIELGAGWSWHLFSAWVGGGPRSAVYVAAEYTESGRRASAQLADLDPALDFRAVEFDYREPTFELARPRTPRRLVHPALHRAGRAGAGVALRCDPERRGTGSRVSISSQVGLAGRAARPVRGRREATRSSTTTTATWWTRCASRRPRGRSRLTKPLARGRGRKSPQRHHRRSLARIARACEFYASSLDAPDLGLLPPATTSSYAWPRPTPANSRRAPRLTTTSTALTARRWTLRP